MRITVPGTRRAAAVAALASALALCWSAPANAGHGVTDFSLTVADPQAGASVNASSATSLSYSDLIDDVKKTIGHFAPGMIANPEAVPHCPQSLYLADNCPADTLIGSAEANAALAGVPLPAPFSGRIYNQELLGSEAGRLGIIMDTVPSKTFLTAPFDVRTHSDYGLDGVLDDIGRLEPAVQITRLAFTLFGTVQGRNFTRGPTSCSLKVSTGEAFSWEHNVSVSGNTSSYTPTGCDKLPFKPTFEMSVAGAGENRYNRNPSLRVRVTQQPGEAGVLSNGVTLPKQLTPDTGSFGTLCSEDQLAAGACPSGAKVGGTTATSPFLATPLSGPVWLVKKSGSVLPALVADLQGRVPVKITIATAIVGGNQIKSTVTDVPDLPIGTFTLALDGGRNGVLLNKTDLCLDDSGKKFRSLHAGVTFGAHSGASTSSSPRIAVEGCAPSLSASLRRAGSSKPRLRAVATRHPDAERITRAELVLPKGLRLVRKAVKRRASVHASQRLGRSAFSVRGRRKLAITGLRSSGAGSLVVKLDRGAVRTTRKLRKLVRRGRKPRLSFRLVSVDAKGKRLTSRVTLRARR